MAGSSLDDDNPVAINVTPLVDIIFCLCVFFMISFKFKQVEGKFDLWLPKTSGAPGTEAPRELLRDVRIALVWDETTLEVHRQFGRRRVDDDRELERLLVETRTDALALGLADLSVTVDATADVPWRDVVDVIDVCRRARFERVEFALGAPPARR